MIALSKVLARLNFLGAGQRGSEIRFEINGQAVAAQSVTLEADGPAVVCKINTADGAALIPERKGLGKGRPRKKDT